MKNKGCEVILSTEVVDINGQVLHEGDILEFYTITAVVVWNDEEDEWGTCLEDSDSTSDSWDEEYMPLRDSIDNDNKVDAKIIGNIHKKKDMEQRIKNFDDLQKFIGEWTQRSFPEQESYQCLLGATEELGELCHAHLKSEQEIQGTYEEHLIEAEDAIGNILIFIGQYCNHEGYNMEECVNMAYESIKDRDWSKESNA